MEKLLITFMLYSTLIYAFQVKGAEIDAADTPYIENCNNFEGTFDSLPDGFSVSKNGSTEMDVSDDDFRGISSNAVYTGGCYAWSISTNDTAIGCQPTADKFTPGWVMLTVTNMTGQAAKRISISYDIYCRNNADRSSGVYLEMAGETMSFSRYSSFISNESADADPVWSKHHISTGTELQESIPHNKKILIRWLFDDAGGTGSRDELGIDNIKVFINRPRGTTFSIR